MFTTHKHFGVFLLLFVRVEGRCGRIRRFENDSRMPVVFYLCVYSVKKCIDHVLGTKCKGATRDSKGQKDTVLTLQNFQPSRGIAIKKYKNTGINEYHGEKKKPGCYETV